MASTLPITAFPTADSITVDDFSLPETPKGTGLGHGACASAQRYRGLSDDMSRQVARILQDLRATAAQRNQALKAAHIDGRRSFRPLLLIASQRDGGTPEHCLRVGAIAALIAREMKLPISWCDLLFDAAALHDIGKIGIPDAILSKPTALTEFERATLRNHTTVGAKFLGASATPSFRLAAEIALNHHECWDGSGYPAGREGDDIPLPARITAVADFLDSLAWPTDGSLALPVAEIFHLLELAKGAQFDPQVVDAAERVKPALDRVHLRARTQAHQLDHASSYEMWWRETKT